MSQVFEESGITIVPESTDTFIENKEGNKNCEICKDKEWIYTCPRCLIHTCSLKCVQHHKKETKCSGTRDKTAYIPLQKYTESHMMSDYTYLEDVSRQSDNITRSRLHVDREVRTKNAETKQKQFAKIVKQMGINYYSLPLGMSRNKLNQSNFSKKLHNVFWSIEVYFCNSSGSNRYLEHSFPGNKTLYEFFENLLLAESPHGKGEYQLIRHELNHFIELGINNFSIALKKEKSARGHFVDMTGLLHTAVNDILKDETIIEFPTFYIWPKSDKQPSNVTLLEEKKQLITVINQSNNDTADESNEEDNSSC